MARKSEASAKKETEKAPEVVEKTQTEKEAETEAKEEKAPKAEKAPKEAKAETKAKETAIPADVEKLMKLYPQYDEFYVTPQGFVHPKDAAEYQRKGAVLYKNKYYNQ